MELDKNFWNALYENKLTGWDIGKPSKPLTTIIDELQNKDDKVLIPGCGNAYELQYLVEQNFTNITVIDIAPYVTQQLQHRYQTNSYVKIIEADFFNHIGQYDIILEQTFFCAILPDLRVKYVKKMNELLNPNGILTGVLFNTTFEVSPPYGGTVKEYQTLFSTYFDIEIMEECTTSITPRKGKELFFRCRKK